MNNKTKNRKLKFTLSQCFISRELVAFKHIWTAYLEGNYFDMNLFQYFIEIFHLPLIKI